jgi:hypothetical protein
LALEYIDIKYYDKHVQKKVQKDFFYLLTLRWIFFVVDVVQLEFLIKLNVNKNKFVQRLNGYQLLIARIINDF